MSRSFRIILLALFACLLLPALATAAERNFALRYSNNVNGQIIFAANTMLQCPLSTVDPLMNSGCAGARAGTNSRNNNSFDMGWIDIDSDPATFDSSNAQLLLPTAGHVLFAGLYWTGVQKKGDTISGANGYKGVPLNAPDATAIGTVKLQVPGAAAYTAVTASQVDTAQIASGGGYTAFADVTQLVTAAGAGTYTVADLQTGTGGNTDAGWTLVVAYSDPSEPLRNLAVFDGLKVVSSTNFVDIPLSGFKTPSSGTVRTTVGVVAAEGDAGVSGDYLALNDQRLTDAVHPADNTENSTIANRGVHVTTKSPDYRNQLGYDASLFSADGYLGNNATTAMFRAKTNGETYAPQAITFASELYSPNVTLTKSVALVDSTTEPGATLRYTITATNNGTGNATGVQLADPIPTGLNPATVTAVTVVGGSSNGAAAYDASAVAVNAWLGTGASSGVGGTLAPNQSASITYDVDIVGTAALDQVVDNIATLRFVSVDLGLTISTVASATTTVAYPDVAINKTVQSSAGTAYTFAITVTNQGTLATSGTVTVNDTTPAGATLTSVSGSGWTCSGGAFPCTRSGAGADAIAPNVSYPAIVVTYTFSPGSPVTNTATVSGGGEPGSGTPSAFNNTSTAASGNSPSATLGLSKAALTGTVSLGTLAGFKLQVRNTGPSTATNVTITDTLPTGLYYDSYTATQGACVVTGSGAATTTVTCNVGTLANGYGATVTIRARPAPSLMGTTVVNTATATSDVTPTPIQKAASLTIRPGADLALAKTVTTATPGIVDQNAAVSYTVTATNNGPASATNVQIVDRLPAAISTSGLTITPSSGGACNRTDSTITCLWTGGTSSAATRSVTIAGTTLASVPVADRTAVNRANVFASTDDPDPSNNAATATVTVIPAADLVANAGGPATISAGATGDLTFGITNNGPSTATGTTMAITLPAGLTPTSAPSGCVISGQTVTCSIGSLANGATESRTITARAATDLVEATRTTSVSVTSDVEDPIPANNTDIAPLVAGPVADLTITKVANVAKVAPGGTIEYTIGVANAGGSTSTGAVVKDDLPAGLTVVSATTSNATPCTVVGRLVTCTAEEIVPHDSFEILIVATVGKDRAGSTFVNTATLTPGPQSDPNLANNSASATVKVTTPKGSIAKLKITGKAKPTSSAPKAKVVISFTVTNTAKVVANDVELCITVPKTLTYLKSAGTYSKAKGRVCFTRDQLKAKKSATFSYTARTKVPGQVRPRGSAWAGNAAYVSTLAKLGVVAKGGSAGGVTG